MKQLAFYIMIFLVACSNDNTKNEAQLANNSASEKKDTPSTTVNSSAEGIVGAWKLQKEVFDDNANGIPDEAELKKAYSNNYHFQFNADGTCKIQQMFTGRYEKKKENGKDMLYVYRKKIEGEEDKDPPPDVYQITSLKKDELVLQIIDGGMYSSFWFFKRIS